MNFDTIIIGSGAGGLTAAVSLSRAGQKVLVLEQHDVPGGWCHSFYLNGHRFTPGLHYIGLLGENESTKALYEGLGIANDLVFFEMNPKAFEHCWIGEERFDLPAGFDQMEKVLSQKFPLEEKGIKKYLTTIKKVSNELELIPKMSGFWDHLTIPFRTKTLGKYGLFSLKKVMNWHIKDPLLQSILNIQWGDHGLPPQKASFPLHAAVMNHYSGGGYYPMGGGGALVKAKTKAIKKHGGQIKTQQRVQRILIDENKKAFGVALEDGTQYYANNIISNADPHVTFLNLVGQKYLSNQLIKKLNKTKYSCSSLMLFLTLDMDLRKAGLDSGNIWYTQNKDADLVHQEVMDSDLLSDKAFPSLFISSTTLKDPTSYDGKHHVLEVVVFINKSSFSQFEDLDKNRSEEYQQFKLHLSNKIIKGLENVIPDVRQHILHQELGTPLTNEYYVNTTSGNVYGTEKSLKQIGPFSFDNKSEIENLYLCGASIDAHGVVGASYSGLNTAARVLNCKPEELILKDDNQNLRTFNAEKPELFPELILKKMELKKRRSNQ